MQRRSSHRGWEHPPPSGEPLLPARPRLGSGVSGPWGRSAGFEVSSLPGSGAWRLGPVCLGCGHGLEERAEECGAGICLFQQWLSTAPAQELFLPFHNHHLCQNKQHETAPRGQQAANPGASRGTKIPVVKESPLSILRGKFAILSGG